MFKVGIGQDSHRFEGNEPLIIGGVEIDYERGFSANSDGDVVLHSLCNALASAVGKGSVSTYADKMCQEEITDSQEYVKTALGFVEETGYKVGNVSISIEGKEPKLEKHLPAMKKVIAELLGIDADGIGITVTSGEELTAFGRGEGVQVFTLIALVK